MTSGLLNEAGTVMNESRSMGRTAQEIVAKLRQSPLVHDFSIQETPRALHQPYLSSGGTPRTSSSPSRPECFNTGSMPIKHVTQTA